MSDEGMSDAEIARYRGCTNVSPALLININAANMVRLIARLDAAERERDALREIAVDVSTMKGQDGELSPIARKARAALTANHSAPVVEE